MSKKGVKVDLATFQGPSSFDLPTGPRAREEGDDGRRRGGGGRGFGGPRDRDFESREGGRDGGRDNREGGSRWGDRDREGGSSRFGDRDREGGSSRFGDREGGGGGRWGGDRDRDGGSFRRRDEGGDGGSWSRGGSSSSSAADFPSFPNRQVDTRPEGMRLKLTSKRTSEEGGDSVEKVSNAVASASIASEESSTGDDKWTKVFSKQAAPYQPPSRSGGGSGFGSRSSQDARNTNRYSTDDTSDPRFSSFFNKGGDNRSDRTDTRDSRDGNQRWGAPRAIVSTSSAMSEVNRKAKEEFEAKQAALAAAEEKKRAAEEARAEQQKAARAAKQAVKEAEAQKVREKKEAAAQAAIDEANRAKEEIDAGATLLADTVASGVKGSALTEALQQKPSISAAGLVSAVLPSLGLETSTSTSAVNPVAAGWCKESEYGHALKALLTGGTSSDRRKKQLAVLYAVQSYCAAKNFPVMWVAGKDKKVVQKKLINSLFLALYAGEIVDEDTFLYWADEDETDVVPGKLTAVVQTSEFITMLREREEEEEDEDDEVDAPREIVK